jgi:hypothetical protein
MATSISAHGGHGPNQVRERQRRQAAHKWGLVRRPQVLVDAARQRQSQLRVGVGKARHDGLATSVDALSHGIARQQFGSETNGSEAICLHNTPSPLCGGRLGWGGGCGAETPHLNPPPQGGRRRANAT